MIVGMGLVNKDLVAVVPAWERDTKVAATRCFEQVGGPVPVALATMARLGNDKPPVFLGTVGGDRDGEDIGRLLAEEGVDASMMARSEGVATSRSLALIDARDGSRTLANYAEKLPPLILTAEQEQALASARLLHLDGRDLSAALQAAGIVRGSNGMVSLDLGTMRPGRDALFPLCEILIASRKGGAGAFPDVANDPPAQVRAFLQRGVRRVAGVTLGAEGFVMGEPGREPVWLPAFPVANVVDTCGAGDVFHGAFLWAYLAGHNATSAARFAGAAAALRVQCYGNHDGMPARADVERMV